uniref:Chitin-binding type-2 domain-containing protein n=1 Tax=Setaria digitata TaxID=48799 RepID=A0A915PKV9_9BILA
MAICYRMILLSLLLISLSISLIENTPRRSSVLDCTGRSANGLYGRGCSSKFMRCHNGKRYVYMCPKNLKFNVETAKCEERRQVIACINNMDDDQTIVKADDPFDCSKRKDGVYGTGKCSTTYYHCSRGHSSEMICPAGLYYNDKLKGCDEVDSIDECNLLTALRGFDERRESHLGERGKYIERNLMSNRGGPVFGMNTGYSIGTRRLTLGKERIKSREGDGRKQLNCTGLRDGDYPIVKGKCSKQFWRCTAGETTGRVCRDNLFFDTISEKCDIASNIEDCTDIVDRNGSTEMLDAKDATALDCSTLNDSTVEHSACSRFYYSCRERKLFQLRCPEGQAYDSKQKQCEIKKFVPGCLISSSTTQIDPIEISKIISASELTGCENYFYFCASGHGYYTKCPDGLFFDSETRSCNYKERILLCNLVSEDLSTISRSVKRTDKKKEAENLGLETEGKKFLRGVADHLPEIGLPALISAPIPKGKPLPFLPEEFECHSRKDGFYSIGCKTEFVACANGRMFFFECPHNLIFDENAQICDYAENIEDCSESFLQMTDNDEKGQFPVIFSELRQENEPKRQAEPVSESAIRKSGQIMNPATKTCNEPKHITECEKENGRI